MGTGKLAEATLKCCARSEIDIETALEQALKHRPDLHNRARNDLTEIRRLYQTRRGIEMSQGARLLNDLLDAADIRPQQAEETR